MCEGVGICEVKTELNRRSSTFVGERSQFTFDFLTEQNGIRRGCVLSIPVGQRAHVGRHTHSTSASVAHFCDARCFGCSYYCTLPMGHTGLHSTTHGNMRDRTFAGEVRNIDVEDRKYVWGEFGVAEMCPLFCKSQGRGHIHLVPCGGPGQCAGVSAPRSARHETMQYGPDFDRPKDEIKHAAFWSDLGFEDPCSAADQQEFGLCGHFCPSAAHAAPPGGAIVATASGGAPSAPRAEDQRSYCLLPLWHPPAAPISLSGGHVSTDGHQFGCGPHTSGSFHTIFVCDRSGSMEAQDARPTLAAISASHDNRLGCVYESVLRFNQIRRGAGARDAVTLILFGDSSIVALRNSVIASDVDLLTPMLQYGHRGNTSFSSGMKGAYEVLRQAIAADSALPAVVIFLSDGHNTDSNTGTFMSYVNYIRAISSPAQPVLHSIKFGRDSNNSQLINMAQAGGGRFFHSIDELQLASTFEAIAASLRGKTAVLM